MSRKPLSPGQASRVVTIRLTDPQLTRLRELGGGEWVRHMLAATLPDTPSVGAGRGFSEERPVAGSPFCNEYGGLDLVDRGDGEIYLKMGAALGTDYYGPLTPGQVRAFYTLCEAAPL